MAQLVPESPIYTMIREFIQGNGLFSIKHLVQFILTLLILEN